MKNSINNISSTINDVISRRTEPAPPPAGAATAGREDSSSARGDLISLSELAKKLYALLEKLDNDGNEKELAGFHFIMKQFIENSEGYDINNFVDLLLELENSHRDYFNEILLQADYLRQEELNPRLWLGVLTRLSVEEAISFTDKTNIIFWNTEREQLPRVLVAFLEEVRKILNQYQFSELHKRVDRIDNLGAQNN